MSGGLHKLMIVNRGKYFRKVIPSIENNGGTVILPPQIPPSNPLTYTASDFGTNVINNHINNSNHIWHSETCQTIFNYITRNYRNKCICYQSYNTPLIGNGLIGSSQLLAEAKDVKADMIFTPYVNASIWMNGQYNDFVLPVGSHYDNDVTDGIIGNGDKHDITSSPNIILSEVVAVSARRDTPDKFKESTSYGYGMEFFVDCSPEGLDEDFPDDNMPSALAEVVSVDGVNITSSVHPNFTSYIQEGVELTVRHTSDPATWEKTTVMEIINGGHIVVSPAITPISSPSIYVWRDVTLGTYLYGQAQSWAVPIVAGQLKVIQLEVEKQTGIKPSWDTVRQAARATAKRNPTGIPEIDNSNWDEYRGFGQIRISKAIQYINNNI